MLELVKYVVEQFAEFKDQIEYRVEDKGSVTEIVVLLEESDMGKVIGRQGRIAKEIRTIIKTVAQRTGEKVTVEIVD